MLGYAIMLLLSRFVVAMPPGVMMMKQTIFGGQQPLIDANGNKTIKYYLDVVVITKNSRVYSFLLLLSLVEPTLLQFMPWYATDLCAAADFPTLNYMKQVFGFKVAQLSMTFIGQVGILAVQANNLDNTFGAVVVLNVIFSIGPMHEEFRHVC